MDWRRSRGRRWQEGGGLAWGPAGGLVEEAGPLDGGLAGAGGEGPKGQGRRRK